jgi:hypothetical protein
MGILATVNRSLSTTPVYPGVSGSTQSVGGVSAPPNDTGILAFPAGSINTLYAITFAYATLQQIVMWSDKGCTLKFNSSGSPVPAITLQPGSIFEWNSSDGYFANPFTVNITGVYVSCTPASRLFIFTLNP